MTERPEDRLDEKDLDAFLAAARDEVAGARVSDAFVARVMADAAAELPRRTGVVPGQARKAGLWAALGGWGGVSGLVAATVVGVVVGVAQPAPLAAFGSAPVELALMPESDLFGTEG